jgi:hypothetical protein
MAKKAAATRTRPRTATKRPARKRSGPRTSEPAASAARAPSMPGLGNLSKMPKMMTPEQAIELYKSNAALALEVINTAIESAARLRKKQFEGEEEARAFQRKHAQSAAEARDAQGLLSVGQGAAQEAVEKSMQYWGEMFDLIVEIQKRLFSLIETQMDGVPGVRETRAAMAMLPDLSQMKKVVSAMQGVVSSGGSTFETMQRVMGDFTKMAQGSMPGARR